MKIINFSMYFNIIKKIVLLCIFAISISSCKDDMVSQSFRVLPADLNKEILKDVSILYSDSAIVRVRISGKELVRSAGREDGKEEFTKGVFVEFFDGNGNITSTLKADYAFRAENQDEITAQGNVVLTSTKKETMETDELIWNKKKEQVYTDKFVLVKTPSEKVWGHGFVSNQEFTEWRIKGFEGKLPSNKFGIEDKQ